MSFGTGSGRGPWGRPLPSTLPPVLISLGCGCLTNEVKPSKRCTQMYCIYFWVREERYGDGTPEIPTIGVTNVFSFPSVSLHFLKRGLLWKTVSGLSLCLGPGSGRWHEKVEGDPYVANGSREDLSPVGLLRAYDLTRNHRQRLTHSHAAITTPQICRDTWHTGKRLGRPVGDQIGLGPRTSGMTQLRTSPQVQLLLSCLATVYRTQLLLFRFLLESLIQVYHISPRCHDDSSLPSLG